MIEEMLAAQATIQAAEIQASATRCAAAIGGLAIAIGVIVSWYTSLHLQKKDRLIEARRDIYLELVEACSNMINTLYILPGDIEKQWPDREQRVLDFSRCIDKATFICETKTKEQLSKFILAFKSQYTDLHPKITPVLNEIRNFNHIIQQHAGKLNSFDIAVKELEKMELEGINGQKVHSAINFMKNKIRETEALTTEINIKNDEIHGMLISIEELVVVMVKNLNNEATPIARLLKNELGVKTDIELEDKIVRDFENA